MVNVAQYQIVATGTTVDKCEQEYIRQLTDKGITQVELLPQTEAKGKVAEIRTAVIEGNSFYFIRLEGEKVFYSLSAAQNREVVTLNVGDTVTIEYAQPVSNLDSVPLPSIYDGYTLYINQRYSPEYSTSPIERIHTLD